MPSRPPAASACRLSRSRGSSARTVGGRGAPITVRAARLLSVVTVMAGACLVSAYRRRSRPTISSRRRSGAGGRGAGQVSNPQSVAVDNSTGDVYVADTGNSRVDEFDSSGNFIAAWGDAVDQTTGGDVCTAASGDTCQAGTYDSAPGHFESPTFVAVDNSTGLLGGGRVRGGQGRQSGDEVHGVRCGGVELGASPPRRRTGSSLAPMRRAVRSPASPGSRSVRAATCWCTARGTRTTGLSSIRAVTRSRRSATSTRTTDNVGIGVAQRRESVQGARQRGAGAAQPNWLRNGAACTIKTGGAPDQRAPGFDLVNNERENG